MTRLIDADDLIQLLIINMEGIPLHRAEHIVNEMPTVDAVPVIRCEECKHWNRSDGTFPDFDGKEWHKCRLLEMYLDKEKDSPMTISYHYCRHAKKEMEFHHGDDWQCLYGRMYEQESGNETD